ncbi:MAG: hypothetical protein AB1656_02660 [Candidatus Omnitrophota bacterium]
MNSNKTLRPSKKKTPSAAPITSIPAPIGRWTQPLILNSTYYKTGSRIGFFLALAAIFAFVLFVVQCYSNKIALLESDLLQKIYAESSKENSPIQMFGQMEKINWFQKEKNQNNVGLHIQLNQNGAVLFKIPKQMIASPHKERRIAILPHITYKGSPKLIFGFGKEESSNIQELIANLRQPGIEFMPKNDYFNGIPNPVFFAEDQFLYSWEQADFFYITFYALIPTDLFLVKLALIEG